jgi:hypothetical protein
MKNNKFVIILALVLSSCASSNAIINTYVDPNFSGDDIKKIAIFPIRNVRLAPSEAIQLNRDISQAINRRNPDIEILNAVEAIEILNEKGLADKWAQFLENYVISGIPNANILREVGGALGVDKILQGEMLNITQKDGDFYTYGTTRVTVHYTMMDVENSKIIWDVSSDGIAISNNYFDAPAVIEAVRVAQDEILSALPF